MNFKRKKKVVEETRFTPWNPVCYIEEERSHYNCAVKLQFKRTNMTTGEIEYRYEDVAKFASLTDAKRKSRELNAAQFGVSFSVLNDLLM